MKEPQTVCYSDQEIVDRLARLKQEGFGELVVRVHEHDAVEVAVTLRMRKPRPA